jgi:hypothetical protein
LKVLSFYHVLSLYHRKKGAGWADDAPRPDLAKQGKIKNRQSTPEVEKMSPAKGALSLIGDPACPFERTGYNESQIKYERLFIY